MDHKLLKLSSLTIVRLIESRKTHPETEMSKSSTTESEATLGLTKISRQSVKVIEAAGITMETLGFHRLANGSGLMSMETGKDVMQKLRERILEDDGVNPLTLSANSNAMANIMKSLASLIKVLSGVPQAQPEGNKRARKSFAASAPPIDVKSST